MTILGSRQHTAGNTTRWVIDYSRWLDNTVDIASANVTSSSTTLTITPPAKILGDDVVFFLVGGVAGETVMVSVVMTDTAGNVKKDTIAFTVVAP